MSTSFKQLRDILNCRNYSIYQLGQVPYLVTLWMQRVGIGWLAWELTESPLWLGLIAAADFGPAILLVPFAGAIADRHDALAQLRQAQILTALQGLGLAILMALGLLRIEVLFALTLFLGFVNPFSSAARFSVLPRTVPHALYASAIALDSSFFHASRFVGPAIAAIVLPWGGVEAIFVANVLGAGAYLIALYAIHRPARTLASVRTANLLVEVGEGVTYVRHHAGIFPLFMLLTVTSVSARPIQDMLPGFASAVFHSDAVGLAWLSSAMGVGAMLSAAAVAVLGRVSVGSVVSGCLGLVVSVVGFVATESLWIGVIFAALCGFSLNGMSTQVQALVQSTVDDAMRSRVMSLYILIYRGMPAIAVLLFGFVAEEIGLRLTFAVAAVICFGAWLLAVPRQQGIASALGKTHP